MGVNPQVKPNFDNFNIITISVYCPDYTQLRAFSVSYGLYIIKLNKNCSYFSYAIFFHVHAFFQKLRNF